MFRLTITHVIFRISKFHQNIMDGKYKNISASKIKLGEMLQLSPSFILIKLCMMT